MKETIYFRHDYDAHADPKMVKLRMKYGREGYGMFWAILEVMRSDADIVINLCDIDAIAYRLHCECDAMKNMMDYFAEIGLLIFDKKDQSYYSERLQSDVEYMREKSKKAKRSAEIKREKKKRNDANALQSQSEGNAIKDSIVNETIGKEIKENDNIIKEETSTAIAVSGSKKSIVNKSNKDNALGMYNTIKELCTVVDGTLDDCVVLFSKVKLYQGDPPTNLGAIINKMRLHGLSEYYSTSSPKKLADNLGTIVEKIKLKEMQEAQKQEKLKGF